MASGRDDGIELVKIGCFKEALPCLRRFRQSSPGYELSLAEALLRLGQWGEASSRLEQLMRKSAGSTKAAALGLRAELSGYQANSQLAETEFREAIQLAVSCGDRHLAASLRVRMLAFVGEIYPDSSTERIVNEARDETYALGDGGLLAAFHVMAAKSDATRGRLASALVHQELAAEHLRRHPNAWMSAGLKLSQSGLAFLSSDLRAAHQSAFGAEQDAARSGDLWSRAAAAANLGFLHLYLGQLDRAETELLLARELGKQMPVLQVGSIDTWAQLCLIKRTTSEAEVAVADVDEILQKNSALQGSWYELGSRMTKVRLLRALERWEELDSLSEAAAKLALARADVNAAAYFSCNRAEALLHLGKRSGAERSFADAVLAVPTSAAVRIECRRVYAVFNASSGKTVEAVSELEFADRLAREAGDAVAQNDVRRTRFQLPQSFESSDLAVLTGSTFQVLTDLMHAADTPRLLASETLRILVQFEFVSAGAVVDESGNAPTILESHNLSSGAIGESDLQATVLNVAPWLKLILRVSDGVDAPRAVSSLKSFLDVVRKQAEGRRWTSDPFWSGTSYQVDASHAFISSAMADVFRTTKRIAPVDVTVLLTGETGVGKEVLAKAIHDQSPRAKAPFVPFNCSAIPREMLESQLFGYRKGAFTGALEAFSGVIRSAEPGTLFLDEVGDLPLDLQPKLLRFLEASEVHPLGEPRPIRVNVRVIAATNADLTARIRDHQFREDLYYRLNTIQIEIPPLRQRTEEVPHLAQTLLAAHCEEFRKGRIRLSDEAVKRLTGYHWPGNIRELSNEMRRVAALAEPDSVVPPALLSARIAATSRPRRSSAARDTLAAPVDQPLPDAVSSLEKSMIARALQMTDGKVDDAARLLGISRKGLFLKRKRYGLS